MCSRTARPTKTPRAAPPPAGLRLLPSIEIESELGQARVERFVQDVIRQTLDEALVFPNFHTILFGDP